MENTAKKKTTKDAIETAITESAIVMVAILYSLLKRPTEAAKPSPLFLNKSFERHTRGSNYRIQGLAKPVHANCKRLRIFRDLTKHHLNNNSPH